MILVVVGVSCKAMANMVQEVGGLKTKEAENIKKNKLIELNLIEKSFFYS